MNIVAETYDAVAEKYLAGDLVHLNGEEYRRKATILTRLTTGFAERVKVLELGCGTGRYFHCLRNVEEIVGLDGSREMLRIAEKPVKHEEVEGKVRLVHGDIFQTEFGAGEFHLIYAVGVFGNGCPLKMSLLRNVRKWLKPGGVFYFDLFDATGAPGSFWIRKRLKAVVHDMLPLQVRQAWDKKSGWAPFYLYSGREVRLRLWLAGFKNSSIASHESILTQGKGRKFEVTAMRASS